MKTLHRTTVKHNNIVTAYVTFDNTLNDDFGAYVTGIETQTIDGMVFDVDGWGDEFTTFDEAVNAIDDMLLDWVTEGDDAISTEAAEALIANAERHTDNTMNERQFMELDIEEAIGRAGLRQQDVAQNTYIYLSEDGEVIAIEKTDTTAHPTDEIAALGYVVAHYGDSLSVQDAARLREVSMQAVYDILHDDFRRTKIFPNAFKIGEGKRGMWRLDPGDVFAWKPQAYAPRR